MITHQIARGSIAYIVVVPYRSPLTARDRTGVFALKVSDTLVGHIFNPFHHAEFGIFLSCCVEVTPWACHI